MDPDPHWDQIRNTVWKTIGQCCKSVTFWYESGSGSVPLPYGSGSCYFLQWPSRRFLNFFLFTFLRYIYIHFSKIKIIKFLLDDRSIRIRTSFLRIRIREAQKIRIRFRNTAIGLSVFCLFLGNDLLENKCPGQEKFSCRFYSSF